MNRKQRCILMLALIEKKIDKEMSFMPDISRLLTLHRRRKRIREYLKKIEVAA